MSIQERVLGQYVTQYGREPEYLVRAPGRVNLIGEHTDYNEGFVLPMAIDRAVWIALHRIGEPDVYITSLDFKQPIQFNLEQFSKAEPSPAEYVKGVAFALQQQFALNGWEGVMAGDVPIGAGLSSSAALELAVARAFAAVSRIEWDAPKMAQLAQYAENTWVGVNCGIMDQMISAVGRAGHAVMIDCRDLSVEILPLPANTAVVVLDTNTRRGLVDSAYNERRVQCETAARFFGKKVLRDVTLDELEEAKAQLGERTYRRAKHVITENQRVLAAREAMLANDAKKLGQLMIASHESLDKDFEVSNDALNLVVRCALAHAGCYGARMTGAGFGGCGVALVEQAAVDNFLDHVNAWYTTHAPQAVMPTVYVCYPTNGAEIVQQR